MAKSKNPLPKDFTAWYQRTSFETLLARFVADNGWYRICNPAHYSSNLSWRSYRYHELLDMIQRGRLIPIDTIPEDDIDSIEDLI